MQTAVPVLTENRPVAHPMQLVEDVAPVNDRYKPAAQLAHAWVSTDVAYWPEEHPMQLVDAADPVKAK